MLKCVEWQSKLEIVNFITLKQIRFSTKENTMAYRHSIDKAYYQE